MIFCFNKEVLGIDPVACKVSSDDNIFLGICPVYPGKWYVDNVVPSLNKIHFSIKYAMLCLTLVHHQILGEVPVQSSSLPYFSWDYNLFHRIGFYILFFYFHYSSLINSLYIRNKWSRQYSSQLLSYLLFWQ